MESNSYGFSTRLLKLAAKRRARVAIGLLRHDKEVLAGLKMASKTVEVVIVGDVIAGYESYKVGSEEEIGQKLLDLLLNKEVDAVCKGQLHPKFVYMPLFERNGEKEAYITGVKNVIPAIFENQKTKRFFIFGGADILQGFDFNSKKRELDSYVAYIQSLGIEPNVSLMTMRRPKPKGAKRIKNQRPIPAIEENFKTVERIKKYLDKKNIKANMHAIEYETAIFESDANIILASIGPVGNAVIRMLNFFTADWDLISAPILHFRPLILEDTFKTGTGKNWYNHIISAAASANVNKLSL